MRYELEVLKAIKELAMELRDFIQETIENIVEGVASAQESITKRGAEINPREVKFRKDGQVNYLHSNVPQSVEFDVGLTSVDKSGSTEGIGVFFGGISVGKKNEQGVEQSAVTKIKFSIPLVLPSGTRECSE